MGEQTSAGFEKEKSKESETAPRFDFEQTRKLLYPKFGDVFGDPAKRLQALCPLSRREINKLLGSSGETWLYALKVLESLRAPIRDASPKPRPNPSPPQPLPLERRQRAQEWIKLILRGLTGGAQ